MRDRLRLLRSGICLVFALASIQLAQPAVGQEATATAWDQARVTELAVQLAIAVRDLRHQVRTGFTAERGQPQARQHRLIDTLRVLQNETRFLAAELEAGQGFEATLPIARRIDRSVDRAVLDGRRLDIPAPMQQRVDTANELLEQLRPFYRNYEDLAE